MLEQIKKVHLAKPFCSAKLTRYGELHNGKAKAYNVKLKAEIRKAKKTANDCKAKGMKNISRAICEQPAKPLTCVCRDRDTADGGKKGEIATEPQ